MITLKINMVTTQDLFIVTDSLMYEIKTKDFYENFSKDKETCDFRNYLHKTNYYDSNKLVVANMKDETAGVPLKNLLD